MRVLIVALIVFAFNFPFGYWRFKEKKLSFRWFLAIHVPIPFIVLLRIYSDIGFALYTYPVLVAAFFFGQFSGVKLQKYWMHKGRATTRNIFADLFVPANKQTK